MPKTKWINSTQSATYNSWRAMRSRCLFGGDNNKNHKLKGITICQEWLDNFDQFVKDMGARPAGTTLDRINPHGNYEPSNCRWATMRVQQNNKEGLTKIEHNGTVKTIGEWAFILNLSETQKNRAYKRAQKYNCTTFNELFCNERLSSKRISERATICAVCGTNESCKWRKNGRLCNTCYHAALRWAKRTQQNIENYPKWHGINWRDIAGYATLVANELETQDEKD